MIAAICVACEYTRSIFHTITFVLDVVTVVAEIFGRTETLSANPTWLNAEKRSIYFLFFTKISNIKIDKHNKKKQIRISNGANVTVEWARRLGDKW